MGKSNYCVAYLSVKMEKYVCINFPWCLVASQFKYCLFTDDEAGR